MKTVEALYEDGLLKPDAPLALRPGERVALIVMRHPDPQRWDLARLAKSADEDLALSEQGLSEWSDTLDAEVVASGGQEHAVLLDALDYRLLRALALYAVGESDESAPLEVHVLRDYLDERISLGKVAELLQLAWFELEGSFQRLGIPLSRGARSIQDAEAEIAAARRHP